MEVGGFKLSFIAVIIVVLQFSAFASAQQATSNSTWLTLNGSPPLVIARGGFSGLFPDSSAEAYQFATSVSVPDVILWCDVQLTRDSVGICFPSLDLTFFSGIQVNFPNGSNSYVVNGVRTNGYFPIDFTFEQLANVPLIQGDIARSPVFDGLFPIQTVEDVFTQNQPAGFWLNIQHDAFYSEHNLSMRSFILNISQSGNISHISSPEVSFLQGLARPFASTGTRLIFRFLEMNAIEPSTNQTYGSLLRNLTMIRTFASGILVPKNYIWPLDASYLLPHTSLVSDAHRVGLEVYAANFANDIPIAFNYSYNPVDEYLSFIDNGNFSVDGVLSDFPITPSEARECFSHLGTNTSAQARPLIISHNGASGDYPGCTDIAYTNAISDGADMIDCNVQMSNDGIPFCMSSVNLLNATEALQFRNLMSTVPDIQPGSGLYSFSLNWSDIQGLTPVIENPYISSNLTRNPRFANAGKIVSLAEFLDLAKNSTSLSGVVIKIENAQYLAENQGLSITDTVLDALNEAGYNNAADKKVMIQSTSSAVLRAMRGNNSYEFVYEVDDIIGGALNDTIADIKEFADTVVVDRKSVLPFENFLMNMTRVVTELHSFNLSVHVQVITNEFVTIPFDAFSDPIVWINTFVNGANVDGVVTDFPKTAAAYRRNRCLRMENTPPYMMPAQPGGILELLRQLAGPGAVPPVAAPSPVLTADEVVQPPLPAVVRQNTTVTPAAAPTASTNGQQHVTASTVLSILAFVMALVLL